MIISVNFDSDDSDKEYIKVIWLMILRMYFLGDFKNAFFVRAIFLIHALLLFKLFQ